MRKVTLDKINKDPNLQKYLHEHSYWYKELNRNSIAIDKLIEEMKEKLGLRFKDKVDKTRTAIDLVNAFMSVTKE